MAIHITELNIETYRGIRSLKLNNLVPINIITGDNNCGKTSVLEVLRSIENPSDFRLWRTLIRRNSNDIREGLSYFEGFCDLFDIDQMDKLIKYDVKYKDKKYEVVINAEVSEEELLEDEYLKIIGYTHFQRIAPSKDGIQDYIVNPQKILLNIAVNGEKMSENSVYEGQFRFKPDLRNIDSNANQDKIVYITPEKHTTGDVYLNAVLNNSDMYEQMLAVLKEYDEDIISINYDNSSVEGTTSRGIYKILTKSHKKALPLNVYGDGMKKAVLLMSAAIAAKDGVLLIDEFETAIHTSAMDRTFAWIIEMCMKLNVQVFMTSHSKEAIDKLLKCSPQYTDMIAVYTLNKRENKTVVRRLDGHKAIEVQDNMGLELR
jgi:AAA15 family ATPase/GTPase